MAAQSSILGWEIPWTEEPGGLQSMWMQKRNSLVPKQQKHTHIYETNLTLTRAPGKFFLKECYSYDNYHNVYNLHMCKFYANVRDYY